MAVLKASKVFGVLISIISIIGMIAFAMGIHSMLSVVRTGMPGGNNELAFDPSAPIVIPMNPSNIGYFDTSLEVYVEFFQDGNLMASDEILLDIPAGTQIPTQLVLVVPEPVLFDLTTESTFEVIQHIKVTSMFDFISIENLMTIQGRVN